MQLFPGAGRKTSGARSYVFSKLSIPELGTYTVVSVLSLMVSGLSSFELSENTPC